MVSYNEQDPLADYLTKLMILEAARCAHAGDQIGLEWLQDTMLYLASRWEELKSK
jgi:hypothetical protein